VQRSDVRRGTVLEPGCEVVFFLYVDGHGLGAEDCRTAADDTKSAPPRRRRQRRARRRAATQRAQASQPVLDCLVPNFALFLDSDSDTDSDCESESDDDWAAVVQRSSELKAPAGSSEISTNASESSDSESSASPELPVLDVSSDEFEPPVTKGPPGVWNVPPAGACIRPPPGLALPPPPGLA
jgi:hypothetical protein